MAAAPSWPEWNHRPQRYGRVLATCPKSLPKRSRRASKLFKSRTGGLQRTQVRPSRPTCASSGPIFAPIWPTSTKIGRVFWTTPDRHRPKLAEPDQSLPHFGANLAMWPNLAERWRKSANVGRTRAQFAQNLTMRGEEMASSGRLSPKVGPNLAQLGQVWPKLARCWPDFGTKWSITATAGRSWPEIVERVGPTCHQRLVDLGQIEWQTLAVYGNRRPSRLQVGPCCG